MGIDSWLSIHSAPQRTDPVRGRPNVVRMARRAEARGVEATGVTDLEWGQFVGCSDPYGNQWAFQELPDWEAASGSERRVDAE